MWLWLDYGLWCFVLLKKYGSFTEPHYKIGFLLNRQEHSCQYRMIRDTYRVQKVCIVRAYRKCSWIVWYIGAYRMNRIILVNRTYCTIHRHVGLKWVFLLKFVVLFDLNKLLDFVNTKLIESNEIASPWVFFLPSLSPTKFRLYS